MLKGGHNGCATLEPLALHTLNTLVCNKLYSHIGLNPDACNALRPACFQYNRPWRSAWDRDAHEHERAQAQVQDVHPSRQTQVPLHTAFHLDAAPKDIRNRVAFVTREPTAGGGKNRQGRQEARVRAQDRCALAYLLRVQMGGAGQGLGVFEREGMSLRGDGGIIVHDRTLSGSGGYSQTGDSVGRTTAG